MFFIGNSTVLLDKGLQKVLGTTYRVMDKSVHVNRALVSILVVVGRAVY